MLKITMQPLAIYWLHCKVLFRIHWWILALNRGPSSPWLAATPFLPEVSISGNIMEMQVGMFSLIYVATGDRTPFGMIAWFLVLTPIGSSLFHGNYLPNIFTTLESTSTPCSAACCCVAAEQTKWAHVCHGLYVQPRFRVTFDPALT